MKRLGEILIERGVLALSELHTGLETCRRSGGRLGTHLLRLGFVDEIDLLRALAEQFDVRSVAAAELAGAPVDVMSLLPPSRARQLGAVPFERTSHHVLVAMINPRDPMVVEEVAKATGLDVVPCVATETAILETITRIEGEMPDPMPDATRPEDASDWDQLWVPPRATPSQLLQVRRYQSTSSPAAIEIATFPGLASMEYEGAHPGDQPLDEETLRRRLASVASRDEVGELLLRYGLSFFRRVCLFAIYRGAVVGWLAGGHGVVVDDIQAFSMPLEEPSLFHELLSGTGYHLGSIPEDEAGSSLMRVLGDPRPRSVLLLPIPVRGRAAGFLLGDNFHDDVVVPVEGLAAEMVAAGLALEILILRHKITG